MLKVGDVYSLNCITLDDMDSKTMVKITGMLELKSGGWLMSLEMQGENPHAIADYWITEDLRMRRGA